MTNQLATNCRMDHGDAGQGRPVVLLHAFPLSRAMWRPQVEALQSDFRVITPDLRGFGGTEGFGGTPSLDQMADDVAALLEELRIVEPVVLGGLSMGGYVALAFARRHAERLRGLILADTRAEADDATGKANRDKLIAFAETHSALDVLGQMLPKLVGDATPGQRPDVIAEVQRIAAAQSPAGIIGALRAMRDRPSAAPSLGDIKVPALVIVGHDDILTPPTSAKNLADNIPHAQLVILNGAGHLSNLEQPAAFTEAVRSFLQSLP